MGCSEFAVSLFTKGISGKWFDLSICLYILCRKLEEEEQLKRAEMEGLQDRVATLQAEKNTLLLEKNDLNAHIKHLESELQLARQTNRCTLIHGPILEMHFLRCFAILSDPAYERTCVLHVHVCFGLKRYINRVEHGMCKIGTAIMCININIPCCTLFVSFSNSGPL